MKLNQLIAKPQLIKCVLDDEETVKEYGEPVEWWIWDRQPLSTFLKFVNPEGNQTEQIFSIMREMILDEEGRPLLVDDATMPTPILMRVMNRMTEVLGK